MKKTSIILLVLSIVIAANLTGCSNSNNTKTTSSLTPKPVEKINENRENIKPIKEDISELEKMVKPSIVYGILIRNEEDLNKGDKVEIIMDTNNGTNYKIKHNGKTSWISGSAISILDDTTPTDKTRMSKEQLEKYVNNKDFSSETKYFVWVDLDRQLINIFEGEKYRWSFIKSIPCASGKNETPTLRGTFTLGNRGLSFGSYDTLGAKYFVQYSGNYMIHSVPFIHGKIADNTIGKKASHGCIRIPVDDAKWFYETMSQGTTIWLY